MPHQTSASQSATSTNATNVHNIVVIGGVAGGMSAAARARRIAETANIIVLEKGAEVSFANCGLPYYVGGEIATADKLQVQTPQSLGASLNLDVRIHSEATHLDHTAQTVTVIHTDPTTGDTDSYTLPYDALILSPGGVAITPPISGIDSPRVRTLRTVPDAIAMRNTVEAGAKRAVVLGAGFIGLEAAEALEAQGLEVHVVELADHVLPPLDTEIADVVTKELTRLGMHLHTGVAAQSIEHHDTHDTVILADGTRIDTDLVVLSVGVRPDTQVFQDAGLDTERGAIIVNNHGQTNLPNVWAVGDATLSTDAVTGIRRPVALAGPANRAGRLVADHIINPATARPIPQPVGTAIVRIGEYGVAMTGASRKVLTDAGIAFHSIYLHPLNHAGYFPGANAISLVVHFAQADGRILGAQAAAKDGADKRIDVLATAIRAGMNIEDLIDLDLAYSPPFGQAKDPVNLAGMNGANVMSGAIRLWYPWQLQQMRDNALILDVRGAGEYAGGHVPGALNIAHTDLRERLDEVREAAAGRPVRVMCHSGMRSYLAHRILDQAGFDSATLSGGMLTLKAHLGDAAHDILVTE
ncbi:FAD-dependent oxidoreductase [Jonesia quinghaiensis]|uniref:FAD-dependent oxidoreductase n=1 Tax=Jonesia quinghaiensis TaxID=262806 RepID=UPI000415B14C|nr:FAD-dependent oxidoreductase [Jonesia quinghaiensis]